MSCNCNRESCAECIGRNHSEANQNHRSLLENLDTAMALLAIAKAHLITASECALQLGQPQHRKTISALTGDIDGSVLRFSDLMDDLGCPCIVCKRKRELAS